jgi:drug/metabolite transporter (DMT)-like permease
MLKNRETLMRSGAARPAAIAPGRAVAVRRGGPARGHAAIVALALAGSLWGLTVPLSKLGMEWLGAGWLAVARFAIAAPLLGLFAGRELRAAISARVIAAGAVGYGAVILLQNVGIGRTSVTHAALIVGAVPVLVAVIAAVLGRGTATALTWAGSLVALAGVGFVAGGGGDGTSVAGDVLVLASVTGSAGFIVAQPALLRGRDARAVTAVQLAAGGLAALPFAIVFEGVPAAPVGATPVIAVLALALTGTALAFSLFAWAQARVPAEVAGAFVNLEPLVGAATGAVVFHDAVGGAQLLGGAAILAGIALGAARRPSRSPGDRAPVTDRAPSREGGENPPGADSPSHGRNIRPGPADRSAGGRPARRRLARAAARRWFDEDADRSADPGAASSPLALRRVRGRASRADRRRTMDGGRPRRRAGSGAAECGYIDPRR